MDLSGRRLQPDQIQASGRRDVADAVRQQD